jgi:hypothetical protein
MADGATPARTPPATSDDFRRDAKLAGNELRKRLPKDSETATHYPTFDSYSTKRYEDILGEVMAQFKRNVRSYCLVQFEWFESHGLQQEFPRLHPGESLSWGAVRLITQDETAGNVKHNKDPGEIWALPLLVGGDNMIGQPLNRNDITEVKEGEIFLGYKVTRT